MASENPRKSVTLDDLIKARARIQGFAHRTPTYTSFSEKDVGLKLECFQPVRSFKIRGAANKILSLPDKQKRNGVITASSGNHGLAVAYVAHRLKLKAIIVLPENAVEEKVRMIHSLGASTVFFGRQQDERMTRAQEIQDREGLSFVQPFNDLGIIAGQGTCGLEILEDMPQLESVFVPIGGGGLISGISCAIKLKTDGVRVIGVQPERSPSMYNSWKSGKLSSIEESRTIADGLAVRKPGDITFDFVRRYVDDILLVSDEAIIQATTTLLTREHVLVEPSGAAALAGLLKHRRVTGKREKSVVIVSGANISKEVLARIAS
jgi:threonine dehydratase